MTKNDVEGFGPSKKNFRLPDLVAVCNVFVVLASSMAVNDQNVVLTGAGYRRKRARRHKTVI
jgi:hypothetical protein